MKQIIENFDNITIERSLHMPEKKEIAEKDILSADNLLIKKGLYNGDILSCLNYKIKNGNLIVDCCKLKFFDILEDRFDIIPKMVNVNAVIETNDGNIIFIKRDLKVFSYANYWDFPAGLVPFDISLEKRIINRIKEDTKIDEKFLYIEKIPFLAEVRDKFFSLYYGAKCSMNKEQLNKFFTGNFGKRKPILLKKSEITEFLKLNKKVYPREILEKLSI